MTKTTNINKRILAEDRIGLIIKNRKILSIIKVNSKKKYNCVCLICGKTKLYYWKNLQKQLNNHCGCLGFRNGSKNPAYKHGLRDSDEFKIWAGMKARMTNPKNKSYFLYVLDHKLDADPEWLNSFEKFYLDMGPRPSPMHTLERVDNAKGYWPDNCIWALRSIQNRNKRNNLYYLYKNQKFCLKALCGYLELKYSTVYMRIKRGHKDPFFGVKDIVNL